MTKKQVRAVSKNEKQNIYKLNHELYFVWLLSYVNNLLFVGIKNV